MKPSICAVITDRDLAAIKAVEPLVALFEVRIDLIGDGWQDIARQIRKPWIACARSQREGGQWPGDEAGRVAELISAVELGANLVDIELSTHNLADALPVIKRQARCLLSLHELAKTPPLEQLKQIVREQLAAGADICKVVTTAESFNDNLVTLQLITEFPKIKVVSFAMGPLGLVSRILSPLVGGYFTYASLKEGKESAPGQLMVDHLKRIYEMMKR